MNKIAIGISLVALATVWTQGKPNPADELFKDLLPKPQKAVRAELIELVDKNGRALVRIEPYEGGAMLSVRTADGKRAAILSCDKLTSSLSFAADGELHGVFGVRPMPDGFSTSLILIGKGGPKNRPSLSATLNDVFVWQAP